MRQIIPIAFIETKDIGVALDREVKTNQLGRYRDAYSNLILTDYLELRWFRGDELETYQKIVKALRETNRLMDEVDEVLSFPIA